MNASTDHQLVFVGGLHRSGTTALTRALCAHPDVSGLSGTGVAEDEGQHLQRIYPTAREHGGPGRFALDTEAHLTEESDLVSSANAAALMRHWAPHWDPQAAFWVEKSPPNLIRTRFLQALFPDARFVMIVRHPIVVALATSKWAKLTSIDRLVEHWLHAHEVLVQDAPHLRKLHVMYYEDLVDGPRDELQKVARFLSLDREIPAQSLDRGRSGAYQQRWEDLRASRAPWRSRAARRLRDRYGERALALGYSLDELTSAKSAQWPGDTRPEKDSS